MFKIKKLCYDVIEVIKMTIGEQIRILRRQHNMTQKKLSELSGLATITIQQYEANKYKPKVEQLEKIAKAFDINVTTFLDYEKNTSLKQEEDYMDKDIRCIQRARKNMTEDDKKRMMDILKLTMNEYFNDNQMDKNNVN